MTQLHENDRKILAKNLGLNLEEFDTLVASANKAYEFLRENGPFYGREDIKEPTFRTTAEPYKLSKKVHQALNDFGNDMVILAKALPKLPQQYKDKLGAGLDFRVPLSWRVDSIVDQRGDIKVNEIEGIDSVSALMMFEQLAYDLQPMEETTISRFVSSVKAIFPNISKESPLKIAIIRNDLENNPFTPNARRFIKYTNELSGGAILCDLFDIGKLREGEVKPDWQVYGAALNEAYCSPQELEELGLAKEKLLTAGNYIAMVNKGVFALVFDPGLKDFWEREIGNTSYERLKNILIPSSFITSIEQLRETRKNQKVAKVTWAEGDMIIVNRAKGVAMPYGDILESEDERWNLLEEYFKKGYTIISQDLVVPGKLSSYLRKKGTSLESVEWYNRVCLKYVVDGNPNDEGTHKAFLTATEVTLGPEIIPAGRACAFTAGAFEK